MERLSMIDKIVQSEKEQIENRVKTIDDLERAILFALDNPVDYEFAIDNAGNIYKGRYTKSIQITDEEREQIPVPSTEADAILGTDKT